MYNIYTSLAHSLPGDFKKTPFFEVSFQFLSLQRLVGFKNVNLVDLRVAGASVVST